MNSSEVPRVRICLSFVGGADLDTDALKAALGTKPDRAWLINDPVRGTALRRTDSRWIFDEGPTTTWDAGDAAETFIFGRASGVVECLKRGVSVRQLQSIELAIQITTFGAPPSIILSQRLIDELGSIGALVDVDIVMSSL
jgi:hypothetical protein